MINILIVLFSFFHPFYVSVTEVNHNTKNKSLEISSKIFFDDLENGIENENHVRFDIVKPVDKAKVNALIANYIKKHLQIKIDGKLLNMNYLGYEIQEDAAWCYLEIPKVSKVSSVEINNNILYKLHSEQINMLNVTVNGKRQSTKLDAPTSRASFKF
jgi:hypothetical protein